MAHRTTINNVVLYKVKLPGVSHVHRAHAERCPASPSYPTLPGASWQARQMTSYSKRMPVTIRPFDKYPGGIGS